MTVGAIANPSAATADRPVRRTGFTLTADGSYAACLTTDRDGNWYPERWTLHGPEPYTVPLPCSQPEEQESSVLPLADGRVLIRRCVGEPSGPGRHTLSVLHPSGPATTELAVGSVETPRLDLVPQGPAGGEVYALAPGQETTAIWRVLSGSPERVGEVPGHCAGRGWLDPGGRLLAVDQELGGRTKTVIVDLSGGAAVSPLLEITEDSNDRLLLADPDSGLLLVLSDAPGYDRLGWGLLGSGRPVRFPEALRPADTADPADTAVTPFAAQPGQVLMPENIGVALRLDGPAGCRLGVWRPSGRQLIQLPPLPGWITGAGLWTRGGELRLPYVSPAQQCGLARLALPGSAAAADAAEAAPSEKETTALRPVPLRHAPL